MQNHIGAKTQCTEHQIITNKSEGLQINASDCNANLLQVANDLLSKRCLSDARKAYDLAASQGNNPAICAAGRWICWMLSGEFEQAWRESDMIDNLGVKDNTQLWDKNSFYGKRVLIRCLHGFGDAVQFIRYARMLRTQATRLIVQAHPDLVELLRIVDGIDDVITWPDLPNSERDWDQQIEVMELPRAFHTTPDSIPCVTPYIPIDEARIDAFHDKLGSTDKLRIGIVWRSSEYDPSRDVSLEMLVSVIATRWFELHSFQHGLGHEELTHLQSQYQINDTALLCHGVLDTAAAMLCMDLIISVDTFAAHLAGALALPVWVMLPFAADWRWMSDREDSPWYPSMRLFRQGSSNAWELVIEKIGCQLEEVVSSKVLK